MRKVLNLVWSRKSITIFCVIISLDFCGIVAERSLLSRLNYLQSTRPSARARAPRVVHFADYGPPALRQNSANTFRQTVYRRLRVASSAFPFPWAWRFPCVSTSPYTSLCMIHRSLRLSALTYFLLSVYPIIVFGPIDHRVAMEVFIERY